MGDNSSAATVGRPSPVQTMQDFDSLVKAGLGADNAPESVLKVVNDAQKRLPDQTRFFEVASDYYSWPLEQRAEVLCAPSTHHLCKTLVFENTKWKASADKPENHHRYWVVVVQYEGASVNITKLEKAVREITSDSRKGMHLRIAPAEVSFELTGFVNNAVSAVGMKTDLPLIVSSAIMALEPAILYLGAGHVDWKIALSSAALVEKWHGRVIDFS